MSFTTMAKDIVWEVLPEMHGKIHGKGRVYIAHRGKSCYSAGIPSGRTSPKTEAELAHQQAFKQASQLRSLIIHDPALKSQWMTRFRDTNASRQYASFCGYLTSMAFHGHVSETGEYVA